MSHTPGPWKVVPCGAQNDCWCRVVEGPGDEVIVSSGSVEKKNAALIAAAPDLLAALEKCLSAMSMQEGRQSEEFHIPPHTASAIWFGAKDEASAAIKKARGEC